MKVEFAEIPTIGTALLVNGQRYDLASVEPHTRLDGAATTLLVWNTRCADCDAPFQTKTSTNRLPDTRRCEPHRAAGKRV